MSNSGATLRALRVARGWDQADLAMRSKVSLRTIWGIEAGRVSPRATTRRKLLAALRIEWEAQADVFGPLG